MIKSAMACIVVDGVAPLIRFGEPVAVVYDARVDERSYVDETVTFISYMFRLCNLAYGAVLRALDQRNWIRLMDIHEHHSLQKSV